MKPNSTILKSLLIIIVISSPGFVLMSALDYFSLPGSASSIKPIKNEQISIQSNETNAVNFAGDTIDINIDMDDFEVEMKKLKKELGKLKSLKFNFDFDNEEFRAGMEELRKELSELKLEEFQINFDNEEFRKNMKELTAEMKDYKFSFNFDMDKLEVELDELNKKLKDLDIDLKDLDIELEKLDQFIDELKDELVSDGLIGNNDDEFDLDLSKDRMILNGEPVPEELFKKYKEMYENHFGKKLDDDHNLIIR